MKNRNSFLTLGLLGLAVTAAIHIFMQANHTYNHLLKIVVWVFYIVWFGIAFICFVSPGKTKTKKGHIT